MTHLDLLLPFGLPAASAASALLRECNSPALATLLARGAVNAAAAPIDPFARALAHEVWLQRRFGLATIASAADAGDTSPAIAAHLMRAHGIAQDSGFWFVLQPAHIHVARDHLVLTELRQLQLTHAESRQLFDAAAALCTDLGHALLYGDAATWFVRADDWRGLRTATPEAASGRNIDIWMPAGEGDRAWRKLQNEIQMHWHGLPLNEAREANGLRAANSLWLWGGAEAGQAAPIAAPYQAVFGMKDWAAALAPQTGASGASAQQVLQASGERGLLVLDALLEPGLTDEWGVWLERMEALDRDWFAPLLQTLRDGRLQSLQLIATGQDKLLETTVTRNSLRKFWIKPSLARLA